MNALILGGFVVFLVLARPHFAIAQQQEKSAMTTKAGTKTMLDHSNGTLLDTHRSSNWRNFKKPGDAILKKVLAPMQYQVTQHEGTEPPFENEYVKNKREGIYVEILSGEPLFSSRDKYDSGTGWPSFTKPLDPDNIVTKEDRSFFSVRTEVRSKHGASHLGHVFPDGPQPTGLRYCMNSAALRFVPQENLEKEGYGEYRKVFQKKVPGEKEMP